MSSPRYLFADTPRCQTSHSQVAGENKRPKLQINTGSHTNSGYAFRRRATIQLPIPSPTSPEYRNLHSGSSKPQVHLHRRTKADSLAHQKLSANGNHLSELHTQTPILDLVTPLESVCTGWSASELNAGRRLIRFSKVQDGRRLIVSCEPIKVEDYRDSDSVISCIYREECNTCFVTSVDIISLLERLTSSDFPVEEKNRIRRNLEGLHPTTVSKHKAGFEAFFQRIMEFPDPKPRNIEKDLKVFEWSLLDQALDKILSKYAIDITSVAECTDASVEPSPSTAGSEDVDLLYANSVKLEDSYVDLSGPIPKFEPRPDDFCFLTSSDGSGSYYSSVDPPPSALYSPYEYDSEFSNAHAGASNSASWGLEYKPSDIGLDNLSTYGIVQSVEPVINYPDSTFDPYETLGFRNISGDIFASIADHYS